MRWLPLAAAALLAAACSEKKPADGPAPAPPPVVMETKDERVVVPERPGAPSAPAFQDEAAPSLTGEPAQIEVGMSREALLAAVRGCVVRILFTEGGPGALTGEVYQPQGKACTERFGARRFFIAGETLKRIEPGVTEWPPKPEPVKIEFDTTR